MLELSYWIGVAGYIALGTSPYWLLQSVVEHKMFIVPKSFLIAQSLGALAVLIYQIQIGTSMPGFTALYFINFLLAAVLLSAKVYSEYRAAKLFKDIMRQVEQMDKLNELTGKSLENLDAHMDAEEKKHGQK